MPEFANPFIGAVPRKLTKEELIRAIRLNITAEHEAVHLYTAHAEATDDPIAKKVLYDVANEERVHIGEFQKLLSILDPDEDVFVEEGNLEVEEILEGTGGEFQADSREDSNAVAQVGAHAESPSEILDLADTQEEQATTINAETEEIEIEKPEKQKVRIKTIGSLIE